MLKIRMVMVKNMGVRGGGVLVEGEEEWRLREREQNCSKRIIIKLKNQVF